jgi:Anti-sigma factor NepR
MNEDKPSPRIRTMHAQRSEKSPVVKIGPDIKAKIGVQLRLMYGEVVDQGVPDRFVQILSRLDDSNCEVR